MSFTTSKNIEDILHLINPAHYKHLESVPLKTYADAHIYYNKFQYALEQYIKKTGKDIINFSKEYFDSDMAAEEKCEQLIKHLIENSNWSVRAVSQIESCPNKSCLIKNCLLDLIETSPETFNLDKFHKDIEYRKKVKEEFYKKTGYKIEIN